MIHRQKRERGVGTSLVADSRGLWEPFQTYSDICDWKIEMKYLRLISALSSGDSSSKFRKTPKQQTDNKQNQSKKAHFTVNLVSLFSYLYSFSS